MLPCFMGTQIIMFAIIKLLSRISGNSIITKGRALRNFLANMNVLIATLKVKIKAA